MKLYIESREQFLFRIGIDFERIPGRSIMHLIERKQDREGQRSALTGAFGKTSNC
jgi:hypothetical protein